MGKIIGIDLGTSNCCVAVFDGMRHVVIPNKNGEHVTPSVVSFSDSGEVLVGNAAKKRAVMDPRRTISSVKSMMGKSFNQVMNEKHLVPYQITCGKNNSTRIDIDGHLRSPQEISAILLRTMKEIAEDYLGESVDEAVITVPAYFTDAQRKTTKEAGQLAGLKILRIINESAAAALAYCYNNLDEDRMIAVLHLGGGTFDISVINYGSGVVEVVGTSGNTHIGGDDFDKEIINWMAGEFISQWGVDLRKDPITLQRIKEAAEKAKIELSDNYSTTINLPYITSVNGELKHLQLTLTRSKFEELTHHLIHELKAPCQVVMKGAETEEDKVSKVILVGNASRMPCFRNFAKELFGLNPLQGINPEEAVAIGASIQGSILNHESIKDALLLDVTPFSYGIETIGGVMTKIINANSSIPLKESKTFTIKAQEGNALINILQGESASAKNNKKLGQILFPLNASSPQEEIQIKVTFDIRADGILKVTARNKTNGEEQSVVIDTPGELEESEIDRIRDKTVSTKPNKQPDNSIT